MFYEVAIKYKLADTESSLGEIQGWFLQDIGLAHFHLPIKYNLLCVFHKHDLVCILGLLS